MHIEYKSTDLKQYFKDNRGARTECTINNPQDFGVGKLLKNLPYLKKIARNANHRLLEIERVSQDCVLSQSQCREAYTAQRDRRWSKITRIQVWRSKSNGIICRTHLVSTSAEWIS